MNFVDFEYLQKNSPIYKNLDTEDINWIISPSQDMRMERLLGSALYSKLKDDIIASGTTTGAYITLINDYISPSLVYFIALDAVDFNVVKWTNKGLMKKTSDTSELPSESEINTYKGKIETFAEYYATRIIKYLCANTSSFPEYNSPGNTDETIHPTKSGYSAPFYIPGKNTLRKNYDNPKYR